MNKMSEAEHDITEERTRLLALVQNTQRTPYSVAEYYLYLNNSGRDRAFVR
jgi:hypothetical protein